MIPPLVSLNGVSIKYQSQIVLANIGFDIYPGRHLAMVGKSGSGKTTLLKTIAGLQAIAGGTLTFNTKKIVIVDPRHHFRTLSNTTDLYYQQRFNSFNSDDTLTVAQYLENTAANHIPGYWTIEKVTERLGLQKLLDKGLIKLSNGETKRLRLASTLIKNPELLLLDQPLTGLDAEARRYFSELLREISASGITIAMATSPNEIPDIIDEVITLENDGVKSILSAKEFRVGSYKPEYNTSSISADSLKNLLKNNAASYQTFIKMNNVNVKYGDKQILKNINWEIKQGERWALLGHNGAGKSTLLSLIYGDNPQAYANDIVLFDKRRGTGESIWDIKSKCGFVSPELYQYFPTDNNCLQVIESGFYDTLGLFKQSEPSRATLLLKWMEVLGIEKYRHQMLKNIPASAQRLCLLARALIKNPSLLILDEPCQGLDGQQKERFKHIINTICGQSNLTLIYVTHYPEELPEAVHHVLKLENGIMR